MANYVILLAGGIGSRMESDIPKQFMEIKGKPIIAYTIEKFQINPLIEKIVIVCVGGWLDHLRHLISYYGFSKVSWIIEGGNCSHDSIRNGIFFLRDKIDNEDYVIVHDAVRPIITQSILYNLIDVALMYGNSASSIHCHPPIVLTDDFISGNKDINRDFVMLTEAPQMFRFGLISKLYEKAEIDNNHSFTYASSLLIYYGIPVYFSRGITSNIKITKKEDLPLFEALLDIPEERWDN